jgi:imidazoleglycerol phosphate synthase glutamine amidotransferase subunit HisH
VGAFGPGVLRPQLGWNLVRGGDLVADGYAYFANSYRLTDVPDGWRAATCDHGGVFVAALERGPQLACQFHPELSGAWGHALLARWLERARATDQEATAC